VRSGIPVQLTDGSDASAPRPKPLPTSGSRQLDLPAVTPATADRDALGPGIATSAHRPRIAPRPYRAFPIFATHRETMTGSFLTRLVLALLAAILSPTSASAEPITVTSGEFVTPEDEPGGFSFFGADGFKLVGGLSFGGRVLSAPHQECRLGCAPGDFVTLSTVAGAEANPPSFRFPLGGLIEANINGTEFLSVAGPPRGRLDGTLRFHAPAVVLPALEAFTTAPFVFDGHVTAYAWDDLDARVPLFEVALVGHGTAEVAFFDFVDGLYREPYVTYTFAATPAPVPEPATIMLLATGLGGGAMRPWRHRRRESDARPLRGEV
jgi:PEP-CTERM motif